MARVVGAAPGQRPSAVPSQRSSRAAVATAQGSSVLGLVLAWLAVSLPLAWGITETFRKALALFG
jgi:hypothetical protein